MSRPTPGFVFPVSNYYPAWLLDDAHPLTQEGQRPSRPVGRRTSIGYVGLFDQRHVLGGQGGHPLQWLRSGDENTAYKP